MLISGSYTMVYHNNVLKNTQGKYTLVPWLWLELTYTEISWEEQEDWCWIRAWYASCIVGLASGEACRQENATFIRRAMSFASVVVGAAGR